MAGHLERIEVESEDCILHERVISITPSRKLLFSHTQSAGSVAE